MRGALRWVGAALAAVLAVGGGSAAAAGQILPAAGTTSIGPSVQAAILPPVTPADGTTLISPRTVTLQDLQDGGATVILPVGATFLLKLGGPPPSWLLRVGDPAVLARVPDVPVVRGAQGIYRALGPGVTVLTAVASYPCAGICARPADRLFRTVVVVSPSAPPSFPDVPQGDWAYGAVETLAAAGVVQGLPGGRFGPDRTLTRAEFVKMLDLTLGLAPVPSGTGGFADVPPGAWFAPYVAAAARAGWVRGETPTTFAPEAPVTREALAVWLARALDLTGGGTPGFRDAAQIAAWAAPAVAAAVRAGYLHGFPDGSFRPLAPATRAQAAEVLAAVLRARAR